MQTWQTNTAVGETIGMVGQRRRTLLVGREREQAVLREQFAAACDGRGGCVLIGGEAGIGKTALAEDLCREAAERGALILSGRAYDLTETPPYGPWAGLFERYRLADRGCPGDPLPLPAAFAAGGGVGAVVSRAELIRQVREFFAALAAERPLVILLDDLHWADAASLDLLRVVARMLPSLRAVLIAAYRDDDVEYHRPLAGLVPRLVREAGAARLTVRPLPDRGVRALVDARYRLGASDSARLVAYLQARAEGNPFFLHELLRALEDDALLQAHPAGDTLGALADAHVPVLIRQIVDERATRLGAETDALLIVASVIGQEVPLDLWRTVGEASEERLLAAVERATDAGLLLVAPDATVARFRHALIREAFYARPSPLRRRALHRRIGEAVMALPTPDPDTVASHLRRANDARAAEWLIAAGERAQRAYAYTTAGERFEAALAAMGEGADPRERAWLLFRLARMRRFSDPVTGVQWLAEAQRHAAAVDDNALKAYLTFDHGLLSCFASMRTGESDAMRRGLAEMAAGADALDALSPADRASLRDRATLEVSAERNDRRGTFAEWLAATGQYGAARLHAERVIAEGAPTAGVGTIAGFAIANAFDDACRALGKVNMNMGNPAEARRYYAWGRGVSQTYGNFLSVGQGLAEEINVLLRYRTDEQVERRRLVAEAERAYMKIRDVLPTYSPRFLHSRLLALDGAWEEARALLLAQYRSTSNWWMDSTNLLVRLALDRGEREFAREVLRRGQPHGPATEPGAVFYSTALLHQRLAAAIAIEDGDYAAARAWLDAHDRWLAWSGCILGRAEGELGWAAYHRATCDPARAYDHAKRALAHATDPRQPPPLIAAHRLLGELDTEARRFREAATHLDRALALADACAAPFERSMTLLAHAELRAATGDAPAAHTLLDEVRAICTPLGAAPTLARADALAAALRRACPAPPAYPAGLTERQVEILRLVVAGRTDREIAAALGLSRRTVSNHLAHIFTRTNTENRAAAVAFALRHGLA